VVLICYWFVFSHHYLSAFPPYFLYLIQPMTFTL